MLMPRPLIAGIPASAMDAATPAAVPLPGSRSTRRSSRCYPSIFRSSDARLIELASIASEFNLEHAHFVGNRCRRGFYRQSPTQFVVNLSFDSYDLRCSQRLCPSSLTADGRCASGSAMSVTFICEINSTVKRSQCSAEVR